MSFNRWGVNQPSASRKRPGKPFRTHAQRHRCAFGYNSVEYEKEGGTRKSERKRPAKKNNGEKRCLILIAKT